MAELQSQAVSEEEFYEEIEAPKFVDLTKPDLPCPDDRYWFCLRVGCDQKHEEEMDHEAIYKDFVLRVMAARSPNVRLRKVLNRKAPSTTMKCPLSAPAKPSKSRLARLAVISSFSQKISDAKVKSKSLLKSSSTPKPEVKQSSVVIKALTTPRNKKSLPNPNSFRSVRNPKPTSIAVPKNRAVAKALVFHSPKKPIRKKTSLELHTPVSKICQGMKQLEITSQRKRALGYSNKSSRDIACDSNKQLLLDASRRKFGSRMVKSRVYDSLRIQNCKVTEAKSSRCPKTKGGVEDLQKCRGSMPREGVENDCSDMEIDEKPRERSMEVGSLSCTAKSPEGNEHDEKKPSQTMRSDAALSDISRGDMNSNSEENKISNFQAPNEDGGKSSGGSDVDVKIEPNSPSDLEDRDSEQKNLSTFQNLNGEEKVSNEGSEHEEKVESSLGELPDGNPPEYELSEAEHDRKVNKSDENKYASASDDKENNNSEVLENDDKENSASDDNRELKRNKDYYEKKILGRQGAGGNRKMVTHVLKGTCKESFNSAAAGTQSVKYKRPKPTNPKPFRLRTNERGILKEANLEKRLHHLGSLHETTATSNFPSVTSQRRNGNDIQRSEKCLGQESRCGSDAQDAGSEKEPERKTQNQPYSNLKGKMEPRTSIITPQRRTLLKCPEPHFVASPLECDKDNTPQSSSRKIKSPLLQQKFVRSQGRATVSIMKTGRLSVIKETSTRSAGLKEARKPYDSSGPAAAKAPPPTSRSSSHGRRPTTIPKKPNFHSIHTPKSCTRKLA